MNVIQTQTHVVIKNYFVLNASYCIADVYAYDTSIKPVENIPIVSGGTVYDDPFSGDTFILVFNECLYYGDKLDHTLISQIKYVHLVFHFGTILLI
jgi:hypothetical protein